jgi:hypothetical protein
MPDATLVAAALALVAPPPELQWLGLALAFLSLPALLLALPPYLDLRYGVPAVELRFSDRTMVGAPRDTKVLECHVFNPPITQPLLRRLDIHRKEAEITAAVMIRGDGSNRYVTEFVPIISLMGGGRSTTQRVTVRESEEPALIAIVADENAEIVLDPLRERLPLLPGAYWADVTVNYGVKRVEGSRAFVVSAEGDLSWMAG